MRLAELASVKHRIQLGRPLPFGVRDADQTLLLARGQRVDSMEQLQALFERGALVDLAEVLGPGEAIQQASRAELPALWARSLEAVGAALRRPPDASFRDALDRATAPVQCLIERDPDLAIFQVLQHEAHPDVDYGARRAVQAAITAYLVAQRLAWTLDQTELAFKAALTMNLSMLELQGQLARQRTALSPHQQRQLLEHPQRSVHMLSLAGVANADWLRAVLQHHEQEDGGGYPSGCATVGELASLIRRADVYTAKLSARAGREALAADQAGRQMFMQDPGHPMTAALVKEFGLYPPGCFVRLQSGELAVVVGRSGSITAPIVACLSDAVGRPLALPQRCSTTEATKAIAGIVGESTMATLMPLRHRQTLLGMLVRLPQD